MRRRLLFIIIPIFLIVCILCAVAGYFLWSTTNADPPGKGPKADQGYQASAPIIQALAQYHAQKGEYPQSLDLLVPGFLAKFSYQVGDIQIDYRQVDDSYRLEFRYSGPGMNICVYTPEADWKCSGYY